MAISTAVMNVAANAVYMIRVHGSTISDVGSGSLSYSFVTRSVTMQLIPESDLIVAPGLLRVTVTQGTPGAAVVFNLVGGSSNPLLTDVLDDAGALIGASVPIGALSLGAYQLQAVTSDATTTAWFNVLTQALVDPTGGTVVPPEPPPTMVTQRWYLQDPVPGGTASYTFPMNPSTMTSPHPVRTLTPGATVAMSGQDLVWEGSVRPREWTFAGYCDTREFQETLYAYVALNRRFYLTDHRKRSWEVSFESLDIVPHKNRPNEWAMDYTIRAIIYSGPVQQP